MAGSERPYFIAVAAVAALILVGVAVFWVSSASGGSDAGSAAVTEMPSTVVATEITGAGVTDEARDSTSSPSTPRPTPMVATTTEAAAVATPTAPPPTTARPPPDATTMAAPTAEAPRAQEAGPAAPQPNLSGRWRIVDTVTEGAGTGESFVFDVTLAQTGTSLTGGNFELSIAGEVAGDVVTAAFTQPGGISGTFQWALDESGGAGGTFQSSVPNGGTSQLIRLQ
jgi:hypothetical protein